ncbi:MAG TPA: winged helix-turn-helix domain-containing protein [Candidatus Tumulicola sp.]|jgi:DNA-binding winged helix-turn-helix (wHTH) protein
MLPPDRTTYCFGSYRLDSMHRLLYNGTQSKALSEKLFLILLLLLQAGGAVVSKEEFLSRIWSDDETSEGNLAQHVYVLRKLLGQRAGDNSYVVTVGGVGYRLATPVTAVTPSGHRGSAEPSQRYYLAAHFLEKRTAPALKRAVELFAQSVADDPTDALALLGEARAHALLAEYLHVPPRPAFERAFRLVERALQLDPASAAANAILAELQLWSQWDVAGAERTIDAALALDAQSPLVHNNAAWLSICKRDYATAHAEVRRALALDPASLALLLLQSRIYLYEGSYRKAIGGMGNLLQTDPSFFLARRYRAQAYLFDRRPRLAANDLQTVPEEPADDASFRLAMLARAYGCCERYAEARALYQRLRDLQAAHYVPEWNLAVAGVGAGLADAAMLHLTRAFEAREPALLLMPSLPLFEPLERRPDFQRLAAGIHAKLRGADPRSAATA